MDGQTNRVPTDWVRTSGPAGDFTSYLRDMKRRCDEFCTQLNLQPGTGQVAIYLIYNLVGMGPSNAILYFDFHPPGLIVAVSIYIASHLTGHPRCPREIAAVIDSTDNGRHIRDTYDLVTDASAIIDDGIRYELREVFGIEALAWPPRGDNQTAVETALEAFTALCTQYCVVLDLPHPVQMMAARVGSRIWNIPSLRQAFRYPGSLPAACVYMAVYLMGFSQPLNTIARAARESEDNVISVYRLLYAERECILQEVWLRFIDRGNRERVLATLPVL